VRLTDLVVDDGPHNSGFRRARFFIFAPDSQAKHACRQAEFPLNALFKIPEPPLGAAERISLGLFIADDRLAVRTRLPAKR